MLLTQVRRFILPQKILGQFSNFKAASPESFLLHFSKEILKVFGSERSSPLFSALGQHLLAIYMSPAP